MNKKISEDYAKTDIEKLAKTLKADLKKGLTTDEAIRRTNIYGKNEISKKKKVSPVIKFLSYFNNPMVIILIIAALLSGLTGEIENLIIIFLMVFLSVIMNFYQEYKSNKAADEIAKKLAVRATVMRNGVKVDVLTKHIVPGDVVLLSAGDIVPADGRIVQSDDFFINESVLTGESFPQEKTANDAGENNIVFSGTNVVSGYSQVLIVNTGANTEYGKIADKLADTNEVNAFELGIRDFGYFIIKIIVVIVLIIFLINAIEKKDLLDSFIFSIAVAVGITPELLPMIMSVNMAKGSINMAKKGVIVKRLSAIPDFGSMDILCTDKTGTLTEDKITLVKYIDLSGGEDKSVLRLAYINGYYETGIKSLLDKAILDFKSVAMDDLNKVDEIPYDFMRKRSSIIYAEAGNRQMVTKGAPEEVFKICSTCLDGGKAVELSQAEFVKINKVYEDLSKQGFRVLAIATKDVQDDKKIYPKSEESGMTLVGFTVFYDPPKKGVAETLDFMKKHGIEIKILTGDGLLITKKICEDIGFQIKGSISGENLDLNKMSVSSISAIAEKTNVFARLSPIQKERIISVLRKKGYVVGYLGDGINDAPSLRSADVGISVDNAVDVAKETADIILLKKGLKELMDGVLEGRKTFGNTMKYLMMGLSSNFGNMFSMIGAALYLPFFPMMPGQILLNNFIYDTSQLSIPLDNVDDEYLKKPKHWDMNFIKLFMYVFGPISSLFDFITFYVLFHVFGLADGAFQTGWFIESLATQTFVIYVIRTRKIPFLESTPSKYLLASTIGAMCLGIILTMPFIGKVFGFIFPSSGVFISLFAIVSAYLVVVEIVKQIFYRKLYRASRN
ncbi:MAG: magnesium-translocating P-type ATPase [Candidatus Paceibacterota bacterium]|jgi:Mg2+-importing ATPase